MNIHCHPATCGSSHLLEGVFLGYHYQTEIRNRLNSRCFLRDFESVPGSQLNQSLTLIFCEFTMLFSRMQLAPRSPPRIQTPGTGWIFSFQYCSHDNT
jgi:hypothetical protein